MPPAPQLWSAAAIAGVSSVAADPLLVGVHIARVDSSFFVLSGSNVKARHEVIRTIMMLRCVKCIMG